MHNVPTLDRIIPLSFDDRSSPLKIKERIVIYPKVSDIVMIEGDDNYSSVFFTNNYKSSLDDLEISGALRMAKTLKFFEEKLKNYGCFFRCSRGAIINLYHVKLLKFRTVYMNEIDKAVYLSADLVSQFKQAMDEI